MTSTETSTETAMSRAPKEDALMATTTSPLRATRQRAAVSVALEAVDDFRSAQDLHAMLRQSGEAIGLTTVYRTLAAMTDAGEVDVLRTGDGEAVYRRCSSGHHHHLVCRTCGRAVEVDGPAVERWASWVAAENGFVEVTHTLEVFGVCSTCAARTDERGSARP